MPRKQSIINETAAAAPARTARPKAPRVTVAKHSKAALSAPVAVPHVTAENSQEIIARIAFGYWESRGCQGGSPVEDWLRAEEEFRQRA